MKDIAKQFKKFVHSCGTTPHVPKRLFNRILNEYVNSRQFESDVEAECRNNCDLQSILKTLSQNFYMDLPMRIFDKALGKFGVPLWNGKAWRKQRCYLRCPLGDFCGHDSSQVYEIEGKKYCIGQLFLNRYYKDKCQLRLPEYTEYELCDITNPIHNIYLPEELQHSEVSRAWYFTLDYSYDMSNRMRRTLAYVPKYQRRSDKYVGGNVIPYL